MGPASPSKLAQPQDHLATEFTRCLNGREGERDFALLASKIFFTQDVTWERANEIAFVSLANQTLGKKFATMDEFDTFWTKRKAAKAGECKNSPVAATPTSVVEPTQK